MKSIINISHEERAIVLFNNYQDEIKVFIGFAEDMVNLVIDKPEKVFKAWAELPISFDLLQKIAQTAKGKFDTHGSKLAQNAELFANELFNDSVFLLTVFCLMQFREVTSNKNFRHTLDWLFYYK